MKGDVRAYAFITDIHGNETALQAVLQDIHALCNSREVERANIVCLGDSFDGGPDPRAVLETLQNLRCPHLRGNHEDYLFQCLDHPEDEKFRRPLWKFVPWTVAQLGHHVSQLKSSLLDYWASDFDPLVAVHGSTQTNQRVPDFFVEQKQMSPSFMENFEEDLSRSRIFLNGHSHYLGRHVDKQQHAVWFNCGSVGYPFVEKLNVNAVAPLSTWVWVEVDNERKATVINRRVPYSSDHLISRYVASGALEQCAPFSFAILAQSLFNQDVVYPFFQSVKKVQLTPNEMAKNLISELERQNVFERINVLLRKAGHTEVKPC